MKRSRIHPLAAAVVAASALSLVSACSTKDTVPADTAATTMTPEAKMDTGMAGHDMTETPARDADQEFVRMMVDHHYGLIAMADTALVKGASDHIKGDAREMKDKQGAEQKEMIAMLKRDYADAKMPMIMPSNAQMLSALSSKSGAGFDRAFRENIIAHHEEALKMIDDYTPRFTKPAVRAMASKMKADQQREIAELKKELQAK